FEIPPDARANLHSVDGLEAADELVVLDDFTDQWLGEGHHRRFRLCQGGADVDDLQSDRQKGELPSHAPGTRRQPDLSSKPSHGRSSGHIGPGGPDRTGSQTKAGDAPGKKCDSSLLVPESS